MADSTITYRYAPSDVVGRELRLDGENVRIIGVMQVDSPFQVGAFSEHDLDFLTTRTAEEVAALRYQDGYYHCTVRRALYNAGTEPVTRYLVRIAVDENQVGKFSGRD